MDYQCSDFQKLVCETRHDLRNPEGEEQSESFRAELAEEGYQNTSQVEDRRKRLVALVGRSLKIDSGLEPRPSAEVAEADESASTY